MKQLIFWIWVLVASPVWAAITYDTSSVGEGTNSTSHSHTVAADANIAIICLAMRETTPSVQPATAVTVGGQAATFLAGVTTGDSIIRTEMWYKLAPLTGAQTVAVTADATTDRIVTGVMTFKDVAQASTFNTAVTNSSTGSTNADVDSISSAVGEVGVYCGGVRTSASTPSADATAPVSTERFEEPHNDAISVIGFGYTEDGAATSIDMRVDLTGSERWAAAAVSMRPLVTSSFGVLKRREY